MNKINVTQAFLNKINVSQAFLNKINVAQAFLLVSFQVRNIPRVKHLSGLVVLTCLELRENEFLILVI